MIVVVPEGCLVVIVELFTVVEFVDTANTNVATVILDNIPICTRIPMSLF